VTLRALLAALALATVLGACESVIGAHFDAEDVDCKHAQPPPRPNLVNGGEETADIVAAITKVEFGDTPRSDGVPGYRLFGFDLDGVCSNLGEPPSCRGYDWANPDLTDGKDGIDNSAGAMIAAQKQFFARQDPYASEKITHEIQAGDTAPIGIVRVRGWNLQNDDDKVTVDWYVPVKYGAPARLDGSDAWPVRRSSLKLGAQTTGIFTDSRFHDDAAYVSNYRLVAHLPLQTPLLIKDVDFVTQGITLVMTLTPYDGGPHIVDGTFGGFVKLRDVFHVTPQVTTNLFTKICNDNKIIYPLVRTYFCRFADSLADGRHDPDAPCDAITMGGFFEPTPVKLGPEADDPPSDPCPPETDPTNDTCFTPGQPPPE